jgi:uncharacterized protein YjiS (DUF1127 family)
LKKAEIMTDLTTAQFALPRGLRRAAHSDRRDITHFAARALSWAWANWRRREIINSLRKVDERLLRDAGIEPSELEDVVDNLIARWR